MTDMNEQIISVIDAANKLGMRKQHLFKIMKRLGIASTKQKHPAHRGLAIAYISNTDFDLIINDYCNTGKDDESFIATTSASIEHGGFYLIQLEPNHDPGRFKLGFASNMPERLRSHRCSAPFAKVLKTWPCHTLWERTAIDSVTQGCEKIHTEVFRAADIKSVQKKCDMFFELMPDLNDIMR
ncbi:MAG: hypothetical protein WBR24_24740 [Desulfobacterales bacterium]|jgi:hypothetical protein